MSDWWCQYCESIVQPEHVTYEETHDPRAGGCGGVLHGGESAPTGELVQRIAELEAENAELRHDIARHVATCAELATELSEVKTRMAASESAAIAIHEMLYGIGGPLNDNREQYSHEQMRIFFRIKDQLDTLEGL